MEMETITAQTPMREIEIFGIPALFTEQIIPPDQQIPGMHYYELISAEDGETLLGTVLTLIPVEIEDEAGRDVYDADLKDEGDGELLTPEEFGEKYLSPAYDPDPEERYGKDE